MINNVFISGGGNAIESPGFTTDNCDNHSDFSGAEGSNHIVTTYDDDLKTNVYKFILHVDEDIDRDKCDNIGRQRNEIKAYDQSPDHLLGTIGETVVYQWKFKIDADFQASSSFTHLHQIKAKNGKDILPTITLTARKGSTDKMELRYADDDTLQVTLTKVNLSLFKGNWVKVVETITYGDEGNYAITITNNDTGAVLMTYRDNAIKMWKDGASFLRPKWGIYRSLETPSDLRDEEVLYSDFSITENMQVLELRDFEKERFTLYPNPTNGKIYLQNKAQNIQDTFLIRNALGKIVMSGKFKEEMDITNLSAGVYFYTFFHSLSAQQAVKKLVKL